MHERQNVGRLRVFDLCEVVCLVGRRDLVRKAARHQSRAVRMKARILVTELNNHCLIGRKLKRDKARFLIGVLRSPHELKPGAVEDCALRGADEVLALG